MKRNNLFLMRSLLVLVLFFSMICFVFSADGKVSSENNAMDIGKLMGLEESNIIGDGLKYEKQDEGSKLIFEKEDSNLNINGNKFENIDPKSDGGRRVSSIELDEKGDITKADFTVNEKGGDYVIGGTKFHADPGSRVEFKEGKITITPSENQEITNPIPEKKDDSKSKDLKEYLVTYDCEKGCKIKGKEVNGKLVYKDGKLFVAPGQETTINGVKIENYNPTFGAKNTDVYFDGKEHEGTYVSFGEKTFIASSKGGEGVIGFEESNPYLKIDKGDYVAMELKLDSSVKIENRDSQGLIPKVTTKGGFTLDEDSKSIYTFGNKIKMKPFTFLNKKSELKSTTSPIELVSLGEEGRSLIRKDHKIIVDNFNRYAIVPAGSEEAFVKSEGMNTKFSARVKYNYPLEKDIKKLTKANLNFENIPKGNKDMVMGKFRDYWEKLTPEMQNSVERHSITFADDESFSELSGKDAPSNAIAFAVEDKGMTFKVNNFERNIFAHESAHMYHYNLNDLDEIRIRDATRNSMDFAEKQAEIASEKDDELTKKLSEFLRKGYDKNSPEIINLRGKQKKNKELLNGFLDKWTYEKEKYEKSVSNLIKNADSLNNKWIKSTGDKYLGDEWRNLRFVPEGASTKYELKSVEESIAMKVALAETDPLKFARLLREGQLKEGSLKVLHDYHFIPTSRYNFILKEAGLS